MARPLVHRMVHTQDRPGFQGGSEWACPFCPLDDVILDLTEADENWLTLNAIAWSGVVAR
jgi:hypothetical protein